MTAIRMLIPAKIGLSRGNGARRRFVTTRTSEACVVLGGIPRVQPCNHARLIQVPAALGNHAPVRKGAIQDAYGQAQSEEDLPRAENMPCNQTRITPRTSEKAAIVNDVYSGGDLEQVIGALVHCSRRLRIFPARAAALDYVCIGLVFQ